ncbi:hypothetical protein [Morganella phage Mecenats66]|nr:hypothetical protein [Morganella phage Mecenats66]
MMLDFYIDLYQRNPQAMEAAVDDDFDADQILSMMESGDDSWEEL